MYLDANYFMFAAFSADTKGKRARELAKEIIAGRRAVTSALVLDELMWVIIRNNRSAELRQTIEEIYSTNNLEIKEVASTIPLRALDFIERFNLRPRDAVHAAIMESLGITHIVTDDSDFDRVPGIKRIKI